MEKQLQLVTYEQAKRLKELGFDWEASFAYHSQSQRLFDKADIKYELTHFISAPTVALALKWFRDVKGVDNYVIPHYNPTKQYYGGYEYDNGSKMETTEMYDTHEECESALLDELLTISEK